MTRMLSVPENKHDFKVFCKHTVPGLRKKDTLLLYSHAIQSPACLKYDELHNIQFINVTSSYFMVLPRGNRAKF